MSAFMDDEAEVGSSSEDEQMDQNDQNSSDKKKKRVRAISSDESEDEEEDEEKAREEMKGKELKISKIFREINCLVSCSVKTLI